MASALASMASTMRVAAPPSARTAPRASVGRVHARGLGARLRPSVSAAHVARSAPQGGLRRRAPAANAAAANAAATATADDAPASAASAAEDFTDLYPSGLAVWTLSTASTF